MLDAKSNNTTLQIIFFGRKNGHKNKLHIKKLHFCCFISCEKAFLTFVFPFPCISLFLQRVICYGLHEIDSVIYDFYTKPCRNHVYLVKMFQHHRPICKFVKYRYVQIFFMAKQNRTNIIILSFF